MCSSLALELCRRAVGFVGRLVLRPQFGGGDFGSAKKLVQLFLKRGVPFHVLCFSEWVHGCGCLARAYGWLAVTGCWEVGLVGGRALRFQLGEGDFGSAKKKVQL